MKIKATLRQLPSLKVLCAASFHTCRVLRPPQHTKGFRIMGGLWGSALMKTHLKATAWCVYCSLVPVVNVKVRHAYGLKMETFATCMEYISSRLATREERNFACTTVVLSYCRGPLPPEQASLTMMIVSDFCIIFSSCCVYQEI